MIKFVYISNSQLKKWGFVGPEIIFVEGLSRAARELLSFRSNGTVYRSRQPRDVQIVISVRRAHGQLIILRRGQEPFSHRDKEDSSGSDDSGSGASS